MSAEHTVASVFLEADRTARACHWRLVVRRPGTASHQRLAAEPDNPEAALRDAMRLVGAVHWEVRHNDLGPVFRARLAESAA